MQDALVIAPVAAGRLGVVQPSFELPSPDELAQLLSARVRELERDLHDLETTAGVIANAALSLAYVVLELEGRSVAEGVVVSADVTERMTGARLLLGQHGADLVVAIGER